MKILVTGGSGMLGRNLKDIISTDNFEHIWLFPSSSELNLLSEVSTEEYIKNNKPDFIIHFAANVGGLFKNLKYKVEMFRENILMNENILYFCNKYDINNGIFCCSTCIFPANPSNYPMVENMIMDGKPHDSNDSYGYAKRMLYFQCKNYNKQFGRKYFCISPCNIYGKYDNFNLENSHVVAGLIHKFYLSSKSNNFLSITTGYNSMRQFVSAKDVCEIIIKMISDYNNLNHDMIILADNDIKIVDIVELIGLKFPGVKYEINNREDGQEKKTCSNELFKKIFPDFKFENIQIGLFGTIDWFVNNYQIIRK